MLFFSFSFLLRESGEQASFFFLFFFPVSLRTITLNLLSLLRASFCAHSRRTAREPTTHKVSPSLCPLKFKGGKCYKSFFLVVTSDQNLVFCWQTPTPRDTPPPPPPSSPAADRRDHSHLVARGKDRAHTAVVEVILVEGEDKGAYFMICFFFIFYVGEAGVAAASALFSLLSLFFPLRYRRLPLFPLYSLSSFLRVIAG